MTSYDYYANLVSQFNGVETIFTFGYSSTNNSLITGDYVSTNRNVIIYLDNSNIDDLSVKYVQSPAADIMGSTAQSLSPSANNPTNNLMDPSFQKIINLLRTSDPSKLLVIFVSDNLSDQLQDPRLVIDKSTNTISLKPGLLPDSIPLTTNGPKLLVIFKKSSLLSPQIKQVIIEKLRSSQINSSTSSSSDLSTMWIILIVILPIIFIFLLVMSFACSYFYSQKNENSLPQTTS